LSSPSSHAEERELLLKLFDRSFYLDRNPDVRDSGMDPFRHFMAHGAFEGRSPHPLFDMAFYLAAHPEVGQSGMNPVIHFLQTGMAAGSNPHPLFDIDYYLRRYTDVAESGANPLIHFIEHGAAESRNPHPSFDTAAYLAAHPEVAAAGVNPLVHYVCCGAAEAHPLYHPKTDPQFEDLRRELAASEMYVAQLEWQLKHPGQARMPGKLISCSHPIYADKVFYCHHGKRHLVLPHKHYFQCYGFSQDNVVAVGEEELRSYQLAGHLPLRWPEETWANPIRRWPFDLREIATSRLHGSGIEFGAGTAPMSVPLACEVKFADLFSEQDLETRTYTAQNGDFVQLSYQMGMEDMSAVADDSLDFVLACHVIEHLRNPLRAFEQVYRKLKPRGQYVLVVPEKRLMFDRDRALTTLEHLVADYQNPSAERDVPHYYEFFSKVYSVPDEELPKKVGEAIATNHDLHFHTWTHESFGTMVKYARRHFAPWHSVWTQAAIWEDPSSHEFCYVLQK
jgi:SAM-dependent methyltransferase